MSDILPPAAWDALRQGLSGIDQKTGKPVDGKNPAADAVAMSVIGASVFGPAAAQAAVPGTLEIILREIADKVAVPMYNLAITFMDNMVAQKVMKAETREQLKKTLESYKVGSPLILIIMSIMMVVGYIKSTVSASMALAEQNVYEGLRPALPGIGEIIRAVFLDPVLIDKWRAVARMQGIREDHIDLILKAAYSPLDVNTIREVYLRTGKDEKYAYKRLRELALTDERIKEIMATWSIIPGPQDIIRFAVREAFDETQAANLGLDEAFPAAVEEWAAKVGLEKPWPQMYWRSHWELPSPQMGFEMLHRGEITEEDLSALLKALDYSPRWHKALKNIAYNVVTRVDARRLYELGIWNEEKLTDAYRKMGYAPQDAEDLTSWTKVEYAQTDKELTRAQIEKGYNARMITPDEAKRMLVSLGYSAERAGWLLDMADFSSEVKLRDELIATMKINYMSGISTMVQVRQRLGEEEVDPSYIETLLERWEAEKISQRRLPSKSDLDKFLKAGLVQEAEYKRELTRLGYSGEMADLYFRLNSKTEA